VVFNWFTVDVYGAVANMAVPLFVLLSGALLLDATKADEPMKVFYKKRFIRIGIPMIFWTIIYFWWSTYVTGQPLTVNGLLQGLLSGAYPHMWFLYLLVGLYLATPFLRVLVSHLDRNKFKYLIILWFIGNIMVPFINQFAPFGFNPVMFVFTGWIGYYLLGTYLVKTKIAPWKAVAGVVVGLLTTMVGAWWITATVGQSRTNYFHEPLNTTMILASTSMFLLLTSIPKNKIENSNTKIKALLHWISENTLPIYLFHIIIMQTLELGYLGFALNASTLSPIIEIPLLTIITFVMSAAIIYPLKKIPCIKNLIG
jgi:surface polysaccharide O-acyltransferase-like enzyme